MSSFADPSSIVLIIGAICIFLFIMHGLWFSNKPQNRQLKQNNQHDMELSKSNQVGKVRIVTNDNIGEDAKPNKIQKNRSNVQKQVHIADSLDPNYNEKQAAVSLNPQQNQAQASEQGGITITKESADKTGRSTINITSTDLNTTSKVTRIEPSTDNLGGVGSFTITTKPLQEQSSKVMPENYQMVIVAPPDRPFAGEDIEAICVNYGFLPGYLKDKMKIYSVYENVTDKTDEVFRICSMEAPYCFPEDMTNFTTSAIALYMPLPPKGKGTAYFNALDTATKLFLKNLGGQLQDANNNIITQEQIDEMFADLRQYDLSDQ